MPELPEVETVRRGLASRVVGRRIERVEVGRERTVRRTSRTSADRWAHRHERPGGRAPRQVPVAATRQWRHRDDPPAHVGSGADCADGRPTAAPHPCGDGRWHPAPRRRPRNCGSSTLGRSAKWSCSTPITSPIELPELARLGVDPLADDLTVPTLAGLLAGRRTRMKPLLLDQHVDRRDRQHLRRRDPARGPHPSRSSSPLAAPGRDHPAPRRHASDPQRIGAGRWVNARRSPVRRPHGRERLVPGRPSGLRTGRRTMPQLWPRHRSPHGQCRSQHPPLSVVSAAALIDAPLSGRTVGPPRG